MANVYFDLDKTPSTEDGTSWANAYITLDSLTDANVAAGDDVWIKGDEAAKGTNTVMAGDGSGQQNPVRIHAVASATTNEPPTSSDLIAGWRTGETRTEANRAYKDADTPTLTMTGAVMAVSEYAYMYGLVLSRAGGTIRLPNSGLDCGLEFEEVSFAFTTLQLCEVDGGQPSVVTFRNCEFIPNSATSQISPGRSTWADFIGCTFAPLATNTAGLIETNLAGGVIRLIGCDLSDAAHTLVDLASSDTLFLYFQNCLLHGSSAFTTGTAAGRYRFEFHNCSNTTAKASGSLQNLDIVTSEGDITEETTAVRTGGASDGEAGGHSSAFTPNVNGTRDQYLGLVGPWMAFWVTNADTSVTVYIANSGAADYNDDDVWLEVLDVSEAGTAQHTHLTTQMNLLGTPSAVTDDTDSTWGTGGNNPQKLVVTISPDFSGYAYCRVHFAKNFASSPETLYVDPLPEVA